MVINKKDLRCLQCGSGELRNSGTRWRGKKGSKIKKIQFECKSCGTVSVKVGIKQSNNKVIEGTINSEEDK